MSGYLDRDEDEDMLAPVGGSSLLGVELTHAPHGGLSGMNSALYRQGHHGHIHGNNHQVGASVPHPRARAR